MSQQSVQHHYAVADERSVVKFGRDLSSMKQVVTYVVDVLKHIAEIRLVSNFEVASAD